MRRAIATAVLAACACPAAAARAQPIDVISIARAGTSHERQALVHVSGAVTVDFTGPNESGTVTWTPQGGGLLVTYRVGSAHVRPLGGLLFLDVSAVTTSDVVAIVHRTNPDGSVATCADTTVALPSGLPSLDGTPTALDVGLAGSADLLQTRCAGPLPADLTRAMPSVAVPIARLAGGTTIDLSGQRPFSAGGLTGMVRSTVTLRTSRLVAQLASGSRPSGVKLRRVRVVYRTVEARYAVQRISGSLTASLAGSGAPECEPLASCGWSGMLTFGPAGARGGLDWFASSRNRPGFGALRRALGLATGPRRGGVTTNGSGPLHGGAATVATLHATGGDPGCADTTPATRWTLELGRHGAAVRADLVPETLRTRCPGPAPQHAVATGTVPLSAFRHRTIALHLQAAPRLDDDGWSATATGAVDVVLRRTKVQQHSQVFHESVPVGFPAR